MFKIKKTISSLKNIKFSNHDEFQAEIKTKIYLRRYLKKNKN